MVDQPVRFAVLAERPFPLARIFSFLERAVGVALQREIGRGLDERVNGLSLGLLQRDC